MKAVKPNILTPDYTGDMLKLIIIEFFYQLAAWYNNSLILLHPVQK